MLGKTNATVSTGGSGGGDGATIQAVNKTGAAIASGDKVWLNPYALTAEQIYVGTWGTGGGTSGFQMIGNPNKVYDFRSSGLYVATINEDNTLSSFTRIFNVSSPYIWRIDENNDGIMDNIYGAYYNFSNDTGKTYYPAIGPYYYRINRYFVLHSNAYEIIKLDDEQNVVMTYTTASSTTVVAKNSIIAIDETTLISSSGTYLQIVKLNNMDSTYTATNTTFQSTSIVGYFPQANMILASTADLHESGLLKCYRWTGETLEEISPDELPSGLASCYTINSNVFCNAYTNTFTAFQRDEKKLIAYQYINGQWVDISPVIPDLPDPESINNVMNFSISNDNTRMVYHAEASKGSLIGLRIYNLTSVNQYAAVPYLSTNSDSVTGYAAENSAIDASFTANVAGKTS